MSSRFFGLVVLLLLAAGSALGGGKQPVYLISFHEEGDSMEGPRKIQEFEVRGEMRYFRKMPVLTQRNFKAYWAFPAEDGRTWGAVFWLDTSGLHALQRLGVANRGEYLAAAVNRQPADVQVIDKVPEDGRIVIWKNLSPELFAVMDKEKKIRRIGAPVTAAALSGRAPAGRAAAAPAGRAAAAPGAPLPDGAVVGRIDPTTLRDASLVEPKPAAGRTAPRPAKPKKGREGEAPFGPDQTLERPDLRPLPEPASARN